MIARVGGSFMANIPHPELKRLILAECPAAKVRIPSEIGSADPVRVPLSCGAKRTPSRIGSASSRSMPSSIGNGGRGLRTPREKGSCLAAEALCLPFVMIAGPGAAKQAKNTARDAELADLRVVECPDPFASHTREELLENTRTVLWSRIRKVLAESFAATGRVAGAFGVCGGRSRRSRHLCRRSMSLAPARPHSEKSRSAISRSTA